MKTKYDAEEIMVFIYMGLNLVANIALVLLNN